MTQSEFRERRSGSGPRHPLWRQSASQTRDAQVKREGGSRIYSQSRFYGGFGPRGLRPTAGIRLRIMICSPPFLFVLFAMTVLPDFAPAGRSLASPAESNGGQFGAAVQQMGGEAVAERVRMDVPGTAVAPRGGFTGVPDCIAHGLIGTAGLQAGEAPARLAPQGAVER